MSVRMKQIATAATAAALATGGLAIAQSDDNGGSSQGADRAAKKDRLHVRGGPGGRGGPMAAQRRNLTYAEFHVKKGDGEVVYRNDVGKVKSVSSDEIVITNNQGDDVKIGVDGDTKVHAGPGNDVKVADIKAGRRAMVHREDGKAADVIHVMPTKAQMKRFRERMGDRGFRRGPGRPGGHGGPPPAPPAQ